LFLFIIYALAVWFAAGKWRRQWLGLLSVVAGIVGILLVGYFHIRLNDWTGGGIYLPVLQSILYPYGGLVAFVGFFIICLPRAIPASDCLRCGYDLSGQDTSPVVCPECGQASAHAPGLHSLPSPPSPSPPFDPVAAKEARTRARRELAGWRNRSRRF